jgi:transposase
MIIIGADYHPGFQQIAVVDTGTGELKKLRLEHREGAERFYRGLAAPAMKVRVGMEASAHARWFERLLTELHSAAVVAGRSLSTDLGAERGESRPAATAVAPAPDGANAHATDEPLQAVALNEDLRCKKRLWREAGRKQLESFRLAPWASRRRRDLLELLDRLNPTIAELSAAIEQEVEKGSRGAAVADASPGSVL